MRHPISSAAIVATLALAACGAAVAPDEALDLGPMEYDASGTMPCSAGAPTYDGACGWRVVRGGSGSAEIWISNIAISDRPAYRVLDFADGEFTARDGAALDVAKDGDTWSVSVPGQDYYRFADALITGG